MSKGPGQPPQEQPGSSTDFFWGVAIFVAAVIGIWAARAHILPFVFEIKTLELKAIAFFTNPDSKLQAMIEYYTEYPKALSFQTFSHILAQIGNYYKTPVAILLFILAGLVISTHVKSKFKSTYSMQKLRDSEKSIWSQIIPASKVDLINTDINEGPWASALTPILFAKQNNLIIEERVAPTNPLEVEKVIAKLDEHKATIVFREQLGPKWTQAKDLPGHRKALFAVFAARANQDRKMAQEILNQINISLKSSNTPDFSGIDKVIEKYEDSKLVKKVTSSHAYVLTVMASMLELSRTDGVLSTADFIWLKTIDRSLWYMMNTVGRQTSFAECAGAFAHWKIEKRMHRALSTPMVNEAVKALKLGMGEIIYQTDDEE